MDAGAGGRIVFDGCLAENPPRHFADSTRLLRPEIDWREYRALFPVPRRQSEKIGVIGKHHPFIGKGFGQQFGVIGFFAVTLLRRCDIHAAAPKRLNDGKNNVDVRVALKHDLALLRCVVADQFGVLAAELFEEAGLVLKRTINLTAMVLVIGQCGINLRQRETWIDGGGDLLRRHAAQVPCSDHVADTDALPIDACFAADKVRRMRDDAYIRFGSLRRQAAAVNSLRSATIDSILAYRQTAQTSTPFQTPTRVVTTAVK